MSTSLSSILTAGRFQHLDETTTPVNVVIDAPIPGIGTHLLVTSDETVHQLIVDPQQDDVLPTPEGLPLLRQFRDTGEFGLATADVTSLRGLEPRFHSKDKLDTIIDFVDDSETPQVRVKFFETATIGDHPEAETLSNAAFPRAPSLYSTITTSVNGDTVTLGMIYEAINGHSGLDVFSEYSRAGLYSLAEAEQLGTTLRLMHDALTFAFPTATVDATDYATGLRNRFDNAAAATPEITAHAEWVNQLFASLEGPVHTQRTHGFLTLNQLRLDDNHSTWSIAGFGGHPGHSLATRRQAQCPLWDLATIQASLEMINGADDWTTAVMTAIKRGYDADGTTDFQRAHLAVAYAELAVDYCSASSESYSPLELLRQLGNRYRRRG